MDTIVIGRNTFEVVLKLPSQPYGDKRVVVLSHLPLGLPTTTGRIEQIRGEPARIAHELSASGAQHVYVDGGITGQEFPRAGQIHDLTIARVPVLIGEGIPVFGSVPRDIHHIGTRQYESDLVTSKYEVMP